jgi:hypothetical protein
MASVLEQKKLANLNEIQDRAIAGAERRFAMLEQLRASRAQEQQRAEVARAKTAAAGVEAEPYAPRIEGWEPTGKTDIDKRDIPKAKDVVAAVSAGQAAIDRALEIRGFWSMLPFGEKAAEAEVLRSELVGVVKTLDKAGALGDQERKFYMDLIGDIGSVNPWQGDRLRAVRDTMERKAESEMRAYGYKRVKKTEPAQAMTQAEVDATRKFDRDVPVEG